MLPELKDYVVSASTPELADSLQEAHAALERIGLEGHEESFRSLLMTDDTVELGSNINRIKDLTFQYQVDIVTQHGVIPVDDISLDALSLIINAFKDIEEYETAADILNCVQDGVDPEEQLALMFELVTPWFCDNLMELFESVSTGCIKRICEFFNERERNGVAMEEEPPTQVRDAVVKLRNFVEFLEGKELLTMDLVSGGLRVGYPFAVYLRTYGNDLEAMEPKRAAEELIAMAFISGDAHSTPQEAVREIIDEFVSSLDKITRIDAAIKDIILRFNRYEKA
jgi:hypothetical protein